MQFKKSTKSDMTENILAKDIKVGDVMLAIARNGLLTRYPVLEITERTNNHVKLVFGIEGHSVRMSPVVKQNQQIILVEK